MASPSIRSMVRRIGRVVLLLSLGYPQLIIAVPLLVWLCIHAINPWLKLGPEHGWRPAELIRGIGFSIALLLFAALALLHLAAVIYVGWKGHGAVYRRGAWSAITRPWLHGVISSSDLLACIDWLGRTRALVGPVARAEPECSPPRRYSYQRVNAARELALQFDYCTYSPKSHFFPPRETLLEFDRKNESFQVAVRVDTRPAALVGVHPCDIHAIRLLDDVFTRDHPDEHYVSRRVNTLIVGIDCPVPCSSNAYCRDMQTDSADEGFDVMLYPLTAGDAVAGTPANSAGGSCAHGDTVEYGIVFGTEAGRAWLARAPGANLRDPTFDDESRFEKYLERKQSAFPLRLTERREQLPVVLAGAYDSLVWEATSQRCYSCGSCNMVCPTCYCFDIHDECHLSARSGIRERTWDGCMLNDFALVAGDHNFRPKPAQRLRHRLFRKTSWIEQRTGWTGCVGCARCERACTAHISMVEVLNRLAEEHRGERLVESGASSGSPGG